MQRRASPVGDGPPIQQSDLKSLRKVLLKSLSKKQLLILSEISISEATISSLINAISEERQIPRSTLKSNVKSLREMELIDCGVGRPAKLTSMGELVLGIVDEVE